MALLFPAVHMTIWFPDVSSYTPVEIQAGTVAVIARATLSSTYADPHYQTFKEDAINKGAFFAAYHWLNHGNITAQARWCYQHVGVLPLMLDCEDVPGNDGYAGPITIGDIQNFVNTYRAMGGVVHMIYLPHWYWQENMGSPSLTWMGNYQLHLCASDYRTYDETKWPAGYGGIIPTQWQYTSSFPYGGELCDFNAYRGTLNEYIALMEGNPMAGSGITLKWGETLDDYLSRIESVWVPGANAAVDADKKITAVAAGNVDATAVATALGSNPDFATAVGKAIVDEIAKRVASNPSGS